MCFSSSCTAPSVIISLDSTLGKIHPLQQLHCFGFHSVYTSFKHHVTPVHIYTYNTMYRPLNSMLHDVIKTSVSNQNHNFMFFFHSWMMMIMIQTCLHIIQKNFCKWWKKWGQERVILLNIHQHYQCNIHIMQVVMIFTFS